MTLPDAIIYLDTDYSENGVYNYRIPHFEKATALGWNCITLLDCNHGQIATIARSCDEIILLESITVSSVLKAIKEIQCRYNVKAFFGYPGQTVPELDSIKLIESVTTELGLKSAPSEPIKKCNNKFLMRKQLDFCGVPNIRSALIQNELDLEKEAKKIGMPIIFKPIFGAGSALIKKCENIEELKKHYAFFKSTYQKVPSAYHYGGSHHRFNDPEGYEYSYIPGQTAMLEEYIEGIEGTIECIVYNKSPVPLLLHEKLLISHEHSTVLEHLLIIPAVSFSKSQIDAAMEYCCSCVASLDINLSIVHFEFRMTPSGPKVIEINPRVGGFYVPSSLKQLAGLDPFLANISMLSGDFSSDIVDRASRKTQEPINGFYTMFAVYPPESGRLDDIKGALKSAQLPGVLEFDITPKRGYISKEVEEELIAKFWAKVESKEEAIKLYNKVLNNLDIKINSY